jgi:hypothetical protein
LVEVWTREAHLSGQVAKLCGSTAFPTLGTLLANLS